MTFAECVKTIRCDLYRYCPEHGLATLARQFLLVPGFRYTVLMRLLAYCSRHKLIFLPFLLVLKPSLLYNAVTYGISIPYDTKIGPGLYIGHYGGIVIHPEARLGANCNVNHGVTIGATFGGRHPGCPRILNNVYLGPGCKVIGGITVGSDVAVGANAVVTQSVPDHCVVVGVPAQVISQDGASKYVVNVCGSGVASADPLEAGQGSGACFGRSGERPGM